MKRTKQSQKKTKFLLILLVLTAILSITATYAWFSSQRDVDITGIKLNVEVAESMQISLDGEKWVQSVQLSNMRQFYGTHTVTTSHQAKKDDNANYVPTELLPVSTIGEVSAGRLQFMAGEATMSNAGATSASLYACSEDDLAMDQTVNIGTLQGKNELHPYLVFDMYLRNYSTVTGGDNLQLNAGSRVWVDNTTAASQEGTGVLDTGLENCARVGFVIYENTADTTASGETIRNLASTSASLAIWEPNDLAHITEVVNNSGRGVVNGTTMPTYGVKFDEDASKDDQDTWLAIANTEAISGDDNLVEQITMKPAYDASTGVTSATNITTSADEPAEVKLAANKITKIRVYIWLEGQDVDCINAASYGDRLQATIKLTKPENNTGSSNTYDGEPTT